jgi:hypothetical protein
VTLYSCANCGLPIFDVLPHVVVTVTGDRNATLTLVRNDNTVGAPFGDDKPVCITCFVREMQRQIARAVEVELAKRRGFRDEIVKKMEGK